MFNAWRKIPVVRLLLPFALGIIIERFFRISPVFALAAVLLCLVVAAAMALGRTLSQHAHYLFNLSLNGLLFSLGVLLTQLQYPHSDPLHFSSFGGVEFADVILTADPEEAGKTYKMSARVRHVFSDGEVAAARGGLLLFVTKKAGSKWRAGDRLMVAKRPQPVEPPRNPRAFNYRDYLLRRGISHTVFIHDPSQVRLIEKAFHRDWRAPFQMSRRWMLDRLEKWLEHPDSFAVGAALLLGQKDHLSPSLRDAYAGSGAMHVLAVSGLHVGIIYLLALWLLRYLGEQSWARWLRLALLLAVLWCYAIITGLSPSVTRAATMFSAVAFAQNIGRKSNIYNTLAIAALVMLCANPLLIAEVGFQLSFAAVLGIVLLQPKIYSLLLFESWFADKLWSLTAVSIAAQLATFPLGVFYFNQFPNYFLLSNFVVIPAAFGILSLGIVTFVFSALPGVSGVLGNLLNLLIYAMNSSIQGIESLPHAKLTGIALTGGEVLLMFLLLAFLTAWIYHWRVSHLLVTLVCALFLLMLYGVRLHERKVERTVLLADIYGHTCLNLLDGRRNIVIADTGLIARFEKMRYQLGNFWSFRGFDQPTALIAWSDSVHVEPGFQKYGHFVSFHGYRLFLGDEGMTSLHQTKLPELDVLIARGKLKLREDIQVKKAVLSPTYRYKRLCCDSVDVSTHDVRQHGAWQVSWKTSHGSAMVGNIPEK